MKESSQQANLVLGALVVNSRVRTDLLQNHDVASLNRLYGGEIGPLNTDTTELLQIAVAQNITTPEGFAKLLSE